MNYSPKNFQVTNPSLPPEDKASTSVVKFLIILALIGGAYWYISQKLDINGFVRWVATNSGKFGSADDTESISEEAREAIQNYLLSKYNDDCEYTNKAPDVLPSDAEGGWFKCSAISGYTVYAYATESDDDEYEFKDGYVYAKNFKATEMTISNTVRLYFKDSTVNLNSSLDEISTDFDKNVNLFSFIKNNKHYYMATAQLPRNTGININTLTSLAQHLSNVFPNYQLDGIYVPSDDVPYYTNIFSIRCVNGEATVQYNN